jgi:hypothetical protein
LTGFFLGALGQTLCPIDGVWADGKRVFNVHATPFGYVRHQPFKGLPISCNLFIIWMNTSPSKMRNGVVKRTRKGYKYMSMGPRNIFRVNLNTTRNGMRRNAISRNAGNKVGNILTTQFIVKRHRTLGIN